MLDERHDARSGAGVGASCVGRFQEATVNSQPIAAILIVVGLSFSSAAVAGEKENARPAALPVLYGTLGLMQAWDIYSTSAALRAGAKESNPAAAPFARNTGAMIGLKAATTASTIFFAERLWKTNKVGAVAMMVAIDGASALVSMHNMRNVQFAKGR
jgi:hypothetical protein